MRLITLLLCTILAIGGIVLACLGILNLRDHLQPHIDPILYDALNHVILGLVLWYFGYLASRTLRK